MTPCRHLGHNPQLRTLANVSLHASHLVAFSCDGCNLSSVMLDASSYQALNALSPSTDAKGFAVDNSTAIEASVAECDRHHAARKPLWAAHGHKFFVCVLPQIDVQYTNLWSTIGVAVTSSAFLALVVVGGCLLRRDRRARQAKQLEVLNDLTLADLAMVQLDETALLLEARVAGRVWRGRYKGSVVAIKKLHVPTPAETQRFVHAIHVLTTLDGPSIVPFLGAAWTSPTDLKCVLEFMPHGDLRSYLATTPEAAVPWSRKAQFLRDILNGLVYLHDAVPMLHGCLDARHVLLDADCRAYLYGMTATALGTDSSAANRWVAPEVRHGEPLSTAADIYALGLLVAELSTHTVPVQQIEGNENGEDGSSELPVFASSCPAWVRDLALSCLATDPVHRPTALDLVSTLQSQLSDCAM
ncbi:TKL protein kinase [Saprolegnia parasitica CBS 223.65]|uniref:TKL protein kinase n=1 Tax=Saprolegnia parasitica (strain CBS 223.65) TaxID=695850 RepID=A0A067C1S2_SAPPC|nr:TKL protein kinase [Saprolegnia parasitica CBS 223.65]KDO23080.1 TKL protein kinase [Saprolegnia parasitica CBS 223.65]|eukprot:XP_012206192.1 TKL protein kinase [Saprolegnia parasitica CBS 223.65]